MARGFGLSFITIILLWNLLIGESRLWCFPRELRHRLCVTHARLARKTEKSLDDLLLKNVILETKSNTANAWV